MSTMTKEKPSTSIKGLSQDFINDLLADSRTRNQYAPKLVEFLESDEMGINPVEIWPGEFKNKKPATLYQGFVNALNKADESVQDKVRVLKREDSVFLLNKQLLTIASEAEAEADSEDTTEQ